MKDGSKTISERATRFLPVDMKDRLKSAFNRNSANTTAPEKPRDEDAPDYTVIFNANRPAATQVNPRFNSPLVSGPASSVKVADSPSSATMRNPARQVAEDIEEAEIVMEPGAELGAGPELETAALTTHKTSALVAVREGASTAVRAGDALDYSALLKSDKFKPAKGKPLRSLEQANFAIKAGEPKPAFAEEVKPALKDDSRPQPETEAKYASSKNGEAVSQKSKSRFFGDFSSTESVRLKVEKRNEKHPEAVPPEAIPMSSSGVQHAQPDPAAAEVNVLKTEPGAAPVFALQAEPLELTMSSHLATADGVAAEPVASEQAHINLLEEFDSMDAKEHESENGAAVQTDGSGNVAAFAIERNSKFSGQLKFAGAVTIDGQVEGELIAERIVVHEGGVVNASIDGTTIVIAGTVKGDICAHGELEILPSGVVDGSVTAPAITVRRGGRVEGLCTIGVPRE